ncbi:hypothetical protein [Nitrospirillum pindoramense]|uniref:Outer membrane beta-barrel porin/alpha-amylase n=1 Tax=Nitrospirillum amazonense TaxID=28077 RepID=A0A560HI32_9PROT|nr:hypothetical protein [Nitrospirillum amazonense]TWB46117.1 hypothetical protein FBZ90_101452 [Nitrospirillum amazonense]
MIRPTAIGAVVSSVLAFGALTGTAYAQSTDVLSDYFNNWYARVDQAQSSQPGWVTPLVTVTPRLEQEFRFDQLNQYQGTGAMVRNYGGGKGLELIPTATTEVVLNIPPYQVRSNIKPVQGFGDDPVLLVKQRLLSATADPQRPWGGDYIVTAFLGFQAPTGIKAFTNDAWLVTPTLAAGKGFGRVDIQGTVGVALPLAHEVTIGRAVATNVTFQYHLDDYFWPELEVNDTYWSGGLRDGKNQVLLTPGIIFGRFPLGGHSKANFGFGYQFAVSPTLQREPALTPTLDHAWIFTGRVSF